MNKRLSALLLSASCLLSMMFTVSCSVNPGWKSKSHDPVTFRYFLNAPGDRVPNHTLIGEVIREQTGVTIQYERIVGEIDQKLGVMIAGKDYPDFIYGGDKTYRLLEAKALIPLEDLITDHAPNLQRLYEPFWERLKAEDGHIYTLPLSVPTGKPTRWINAAFWVQKKVLKEAGYPVIRTFDEYVELLRNYWHKHPFYEGQPTIPFEILTYDIRNFTLTTAMQFLAGGPNDSRVMVDPASGSLHFYQTDESITRRYYKKLNDMFLEGMIDREAFVMTYEQYLEKLAGGRVLGMFDQSWQIQEAQLALKEAGKFEEMYAPLQLTFEADTRAEYLENAAMNYGIGLGVSVGCDDPVRAIRFVDYMASEEAQLLRYWGIEGQQYQISGQGRLYRTEEQRTWLHNKRNRLHLSGDILYYWPGSTGTMPDGNSYDPAVQPEEVQAEYSDVDKELLAAYGVQTYEELFHPPNPKRIYFPAWSIELSDEAKVFDQKLSDLNKRYPPQMVVAETKAEFDHYWREYVGAVSRLDVEGWLSELKEKIHKRQTDWQ
ncbi:extracellular solute-binding protein [Paenibacillus tarimensis]|uniref:extracellular solute-binding protein n=1 Tax=Paenibacillus tarimensis TaxID=416012 RepID=UPI001F272EDE|nr:extracellular solute-binding protein [Paenibacillus tarimensis]MCF2946382.1 extracellular solute-binding protein [Paenibacillus tarimensis]